jgi:hypothetical protein
MYGLFLVLLTVGLSIGIIAYSRRKQRSMANTQGAKLKFDGDDKMAGGKRRQVEELFLRYQADWSKGDVLAMREYMTDRYYRRASLMMRALEQQERRNVVEEVKAGNVTGATGENGELIVTFNGASAMDKIIDVKSGRALSGRKVNFTETWSFERSADGRLLLDFTVPGTMERRMVIDDMLSFANEHQLEYFADWGTLTLPTRGVIFGKGGFEKSDINNYMVGEYGGQLVQMYSYTPNVNIQLNEKPYPIYLVGQMAVTGKSYGGIIVRRRKWLRRKPKGYRKYDLEWAEFNRKYEVWATDMDKVTSFELLNPKFMEYLHDEVGIDFSLEVVDNLVYFYVKIGVDVKHYEVLLGVLGRAFKEMRR